MNFIFHCFVIFFFLRKYLRKMSQLEDDNERLPLTSGVSIAPINQSATTQAASDEASNSEVAEVIGIAVEEELNLNQNLSPDEQLQLEELKPSNLAAKNNYQEDFSTIAWDQEESRERQRRNRIYQQVCY